MQTTSKRVLVASALALGGMLGMETTPSSAQTFTSGAAAAPGTYSTTPYRPSGVNSGVVTDPGTFASSYSTTAGAGVVGTTAPAPGAYAAPYTGPAGAVRGTTTAAGMPPNSYVNVAGARSAAPTMRAPAPNPYTTAPAASTVPGTYRRSSGPAGNGNPNAAGNYWGPYTPPAPPKKPSFFRRLFSFLDQSDSDGDTSNAPSAYRDPATGQNFPIPRPWMQQQPPR